MSSLDLTLQTATTALSTAQQSINVITRNVSSASVPGYTRKTAPQESITLNGQSVGVRVLEVQRFVNARLQTDLRSSNSSAEAMRVQDDLLSRLELSFGKPGDNSSAASLIANLTDSFRTLSTQPDSVTTQASVIAAADAVARDLNRLSKSVQDLRSEADAGIQASVDTVNTALTKLDSVNAEIVTRKAAGESTADLEDTRDTLMDSLSKEIDISYFKRDNGEVWIMTKSGRALLDVAPHPLQFAPTSVVTPVAKYTPPPGPTTLSGITLDGVDITSEIKGGHVAGYLTLRDTVLPQAQNQLDELASVMTQRFTAAGVTLFFDGGAAYNPVNVLGFSDRIAVNPNVVAQPRALRHGTNAAGVVNPVPVPDLAGDNTIPLAVVSMFEAQQTFAAAPGLGTSGTVEGYAAALISFQGTQHANVSDALGTEDLVNQSMGQRLRNESGVNTDQELALMIQFQNSYNAAARMISVVRDMYDTLFKMT